MDNENKLIARVVGTIVGLVILLILIFNSFVVVGSGYIGIKTTFGKVSGELQPGVSLKWPIVESATPMSVQIQNLTTNETAATNDLQDVNTNITVNYNLVHSQVDNIFVNLTSAYSLNYIQPIVSEAVKSVTAKYTAAQLLTERPQVASDIENVLVTKLSPKGINVDNLSITNFQFSAQYTASIEAKVSAQQAAEQAQYNLQKAQLDAQANQVQDAALSPAILEQQAISKWDGKMPTTVSGSATIFSIPVGQ